MLPALPARPACTMQRRRAPSWRRPSGAPTPCRSSCRPRCSRTRSRRRRRPTGSRQRRCRGWWGGQGARRGQAASRRGRAQNARLAAPAGGLARSARARTLPRRARTGPPGMLGRRPPLLPSLLSLLLLRRPPPPPGGSDSAYSQLGVHLDALAVDDQLAAALLAVDVVRKAAVHRVVLQAGGGGWKTAERGGVRRCAAGGRPARPGLSSIQALSELSLSLAVPPLFFFPLSSF